MSIKKFSILALLAGVSVAANTALASVEKFYKGRKITITVGASAGGGYDFYTRTLAMRWRPKESKLALQCSTT